MLEIYRAFEQLAPCDCGNSQRAVTVEDSRITISCRACGRQVITDEVRAVEDWEEELRYNPYHDSKGRFSSGSGAGGSSENVFQGEDINSKPGKADNTSANMEYINSQEYADKFKGRYANPEVEKAVVNACRQLIKNRDGTNYEEAFFIDATTGKTLSYVKGKKPNNVNMSEKLKGRLTKAKDQSIIMIHNHPNSSHFSVEDYITSSNYKSAFETIACGHNGDVYAFRKTYGTKGKRIEVHKYEAVRDYRVSYSKHSKRTTDFEARNIAWTETAEKWGFSYERL